MRSLFSTVIIKNSFEPVHAKNRKLKAPYITSIIHELLLRVTNQNRPLQKLASFFHRILIDKISNSALSNLLY